MLYTADMRKRTAMASRLSRSRVWPVVGVVGTGVRAALLVGAVWLGQSAGPAGLGAAWGEPAAVGRDELRCDGEGCSLGACRTQTFWANPEKVSEQARAVPRFVDGQPRGIQLFGLRPGTLLAQLGLLNGDVVVGLNGRVLTTPETALTAYVECKDAPTITAAIERKGQPLTRLIRFDHRPLAEGECPPPSKPAERPAVTPAGKPPAVSPLKPAPTAEAELHRIARDITCKATRCTLGNGVVDRILADSNLVASSARIIPVMQDGKAIGFKMMAIRAGSLWALLGLKNGDVVRTINEYELTAPDIALEAYSKLRQADELRVRLDRSGAPLVLTYVLKR